MRAYQRFALLALSAGLLAACGKPSTTSDSAPLAYAPADTPYAYGNLEPLPAAVTEQWSKHLQDYLPEMLGIYDHLLDKADKDAKPEDAELIKTLRVLLGELKSHPNWDKLREIGLKPDGLMAFYGVGLVPVLRLELGDPAKFRAEIANIETQLGRKLTVSKTGAQEYWQLGSSEAACAIAIEGNQLVVTVVPTNGDDALKQALLGVTKPAQSLAAAGTLDQLRGQYKFSQYGTGFVDFVRLTERLSSGPTGTDAAFAKAVGLPLPPPTDAQCKADYLDLAHHFPRIVLGASELSAQRMDIRVQLEIETVLAGEIAAAFGAAPGTGAPADGIMDVALSLPLLKLKDFWIKQADKIAAKPFTCAQLTKLNDSYRDSKQKVDVTVPPPASDLTGLRFTLDGFEMATAPSALPDVHAKLLMATNNPGGALAMAQLAIPPLKDLKLAPDGKAVALPAGLVPAPNAPPMFAAMSDKAIAIAAGSGEDASLSAYLSAPPASESVFLRMTFSGKLYGVILHSMDKMSAMMPAEQQAEFAQQKKLFELYEKWLKRGEISLIATPTGIALREVIEQN